MIKYICNTKRKGETKEFSPFFIFFSFLGREKEILNKEGSVVMYETLQSKVG